MVTSQTNGKICEHSGTFAQCGPCLIDLMELNPALLVRAADKTAALDKMAKIHGWYRDDRGDHNNRPFNVNSVTVILDHGNGETSTESWETGTGTHRVVKGQVAEGQGEVLDAAHGESGG